ncbi:MAG: tetratricopeptide repeat protein [Pseudolabrys sp.]
MTGSCHRPTGVCAHARARPPVRGGGARLLPALLLVVAVLTGAPARADMLPGRVSTATDHGFARMVFKFDQPVPARVSLNWPILVVHFGKPVNVSVDRLSEGMPTYISAARSDPDGTAVRIALVRKVKFHVIPAGRRLFIDLLPESWSGLLPGLPQDVIDELARRADEADKLIDKAQRATQKALANPIRVKVATLPTFSRYIFDLKTKTHVDPERGENTYTLHFDQPIKWDLGDALSALPATVRMIDTSHTANTASVRFKLKGDPQVSTFHDGRSFVIDIGHAGSSARQALAAGAAELAARAPGAPAIAPPETVPAAAAKPAAPPESRHAVAPPSPKALKALVPIAPRAAKALPQPPARKQTAHKAPHHKPAMQDAAQVPAPNPNAPVVAGLHRDGQALEIEFPFAVPTPAAIFRRDATVWMVFDNPAKIDLGKLAAETGGAIRDATVTRSEDGAAVVRLRLRRPRLVSVDNDGPAWTVTIADTVTTASQPLAVTRVMVGRARANLIVPFPHPGKLHALRDPEVGDRLLVMTGLAPVRGFLRARDFVELNVLASRQGVVVEPIADDVTGKVGPDNVTFARPGGLALSAATDPEQQSTASFRATAFDNQIWSLDRSGNYFKRESKLIEMAAAAPRGKRKVARLNLARFYLARRMSAEAMGVLNVAYADDGDDVTGSVLKSVANIMLGRPGAALKDLSQPQVGNQLNAPVWRAIAYAHQGKWAKAHKLFANVETTVAALPLELQRMALLAALHAAVEVRDFGQAGRLVNLLDGVGVPAAMKPEFAVLVGLLDEGLGRNNDALIKFEAAASSPVRPAAAQGRLHDIELRYKLGKMKDKQAVAALETLTTVWRGDATEAEGLRLLAHLYTKEAHYREAFHVMRVALLAHPNSDLTRKIQDEAASTFESLFLSHKGDTLPPIEALGLFYDYRELTPIGRRGDEMIRRLADRLVAVDLLDQAAKLLQHQVDHRLQGAARAQVATKLAVIYLKDHKPARALATLKSTRAALLNSELRDQRLLLQARALSDLGRYDLALQLIKDVKGRQAMRLRADILWAASRWDKAAEEIELLYGKRWKDFRPLNAGERFDILRAAIGYALADDTLGVRRFRDKYAAKMDSGPDAHAFDVVTSPIGTGNTEFRAVATHVASLDTLDAFLADMRKRYPSSDALPPKDKGPAGNSANAEPAAPKLSPPETVSPAAGNSGGKPDGKSGPNPPAAAPKPPKGVPLMPDQPTGSITRQ